MLTKDDIEFIQENRTSGEMDDGTPWVAVPNCPGRDPFTLDEILEALRIKSGTNEAGPEKIRKRACIGQRGTSDED